MAVYYNLNHLKQSQSFHFTRLYEPGAAAPYAGIYRCEHCPYEETVLKNQRLPSARSHAHAPTQPVIQWRLIVASEPMP